MAISITTYALSKKYTDDSIAGGGISAGKNCVIESITAITGGHRVTFKWTLDNGTVKTDTMDVMDGSDSQKTTLPAASSSELGNIYQYTGTTTADYTHGFFYECVLEGGSYSWKKLKVSEGGGGSSELTEDLTATREVGGISVGDNFTEGTALEEIFRDMLCPTDYPTLTNPSVSLSATGAKLIEKGGSLNTTMTASFNRGSINPAYGTSGYRSGAATGYTLNGGASQPTGSFSVTVTESTTSYQASVSYEAGEQPKDSTGANYGSPLPAGSINSNTITYEFVDAIWANTASIDTVAKLALVSKTAKAKEFNFPAQTVSNPEVFDIPTSWTVTGVLAKNPLSGQYADCSSEFTVSNTTHEDAAGNTVNYKRYTDNRGYNAGARTIKVTWS